MFLAKFRPTHRLRVLVYIVGICGLSFLTFYLLLGPFFSLNTIICTDELGTACPQKLIPIVTAYQNHPLLLLSPSVIQARLEADFPQLQVISRVILWPNTLKFVVKPRSIAFRIEKSLSDPLILFDSDAKVIGFTADRSTGQAYFEYPDLPAIQLGDTVKDPLMLFAFRLVQALAQAQIGYHHLVLLPPDNISFDLDQGKKVFLSSNQDLSRQVTSLQAILTLPTMQEGLTVIDLRFQKPVLRPPRDL